jgi:spore coat polysaccharide biosynthesis protein SpsF (cytidylyltransferase family)
MSRQVGVVTLVAVRLKSRRMPRKALADLAGQPLIVRLTERVSQAKLPGAVYWCTSTNADDDPLEALADQTDAWIYRGDELDVMSRFIEVAWSRNAETVVRVTGDNPLTDPVMLDHMVDAHLAAGADYTYTEDLPRGTRCEVVSTDALERCHDLAEDASASEYMTAMLRRPDHFKTVAVEAPDPRLKRPELRLTVDHPEDLEVVRAIYENFDGAPPALADVITWLDEHPGIAQTNAGIASGEIDPAVDVRLRGDAD